MDSPRLDGELLLSRVLGLERIQLYTQFDRPLSENELKEYKTLLQRRAAREPLAYILGEREFFSLKFKVGPGVLVPRPETEQIVERGLEFLKKHGETPQRILDVGTGSGCILISLLVSDQNSTGLGVDYSEGALRIARENAENQGLNGRVLWQKVDFYQSPLDDLSGPFDLITANLPYVSREDYSRLQPEVRDYEPKEALVAGPEGLDAFQALFPQWGNLLKPGGLLLLELDDSQSPSLLGLAEKLLPQWEARLWRDLAGHHRVLSLHRPGP